jgi:hypothetical protein
MSRLKRLLDDYVRNAPGVSEPAEPIDWAAYEDRMRQLQEKWKEEDRKRLARYNETLHPRFRIRK